MSSPAPSATGTLGATPFVELLVYTLDHALTGSLVLEEPGGHKHALSFRQGAVTKARASGALRGELERVTGSATLRATLLAFARLPEATAYGYYDGVDLLERMPASTEPVGSPLLLAWTVIREAADPKRVAELVARLAGRPLRLDARVPASSFAADPDAAAIVQRLRASPLGHAELEALGLLPRERLERFLYALALFRHLDLGGTLGPVGVSPSGRSGMMAAVTGKSAAIPAVSAATKSTPDPAPTTAQRVELEAWKTRLEGDHHTVLGVPQSATQDQIQSAFLRLAKQWHPDRVADADPATRELAPRIFARVSEARTVLLDPLQRRPSMARGSAVSSAQEDEQVERVLAAATAFQKAQILLKARNFAGAEAEAKSALAQDPDQPDYLALVAWIAAQKPEADVARAIAELDRALLKRPNDATARWYRGQLRKRAGQEGLAIQDFRAVVELDPRHVDAQREIRLYEMRSEARREGKNPEPPSGASGERPGLLGKLFKR